MALFGDSLCNGPMLNPCSQKATYKVMDKQRTNNNLLSWNGRQNLDSSWQTQLATNVGQSTSLQLISTEAAHAVLLGKANTKRDHLKSWLNKHWKPIQYLLSVEVSDAVQKKMHLWLSLHHMGKMYVVWISTYGRIISVSIFSTTAWLYSVCI